MGLGESFRSAEKSAETDESVCGGAGNAGGGDERCEGYVGGEESAADECGYPPDDDDGVAGLTVVDFGDPAGEWEDSVASDGEDEAGSGNNGNCGVLWVGCGD